MGSPEDVAELPLDITMSSLLELFFSSMVPTEGDLVGRGEVFLVTTGLDKNLHAELVDGRQLGGGMAQGEGEEVVVGTTGELGEA